MNDFEAVDLVEQSVIRQKRKPKLEAECGDPEIVTEGLAFFKRLREGSNFGQIVSDADVMSDRVEIWSDHFAARQQQVHLRCVFLRLPRTGRAEAQFSKDKQGHEQLARCFQRKWERARRPQGVDGSVRVERQTVKRQCCLSRTLRERLARAPVLLLR